MVNPPKILNGSMSGSASVSGFKQLRFFPRAKSDILVLASEANDGLRGTKTKSNFFWGVRVPPYYEKEYHEKFISIFNRLEREFKGTFVPHLTIFAFFE